MKRTLQETVQKTYPIIKAEQLADTMKDTVESALAQLRREFRLTAQDGHVIYGQCFRARKCGKGSILISHGCTESCEKYREMIWYFLREGYSVCILDHRGHGRSRDGVHGDATHVVHFQDYVDDLAAVVEEQLRSLPEPYYLYAHSMGGLIGGLYLQQHPTVFSKAVFNAPMFEINRAGLPYWAAKSMASLLCLLGRGEKRLPGQGTFCEQEDFAGAATNCRERYLYYFRQQLQNEDLQSNGSSCRWALESFRAGERFLRKDACAGVRIPVLVFQAEKDDYVLPGAQERFVEAVPNGQLVYVPGAKHEIYLSNDEILQMYLEAILEFLA